MAKKIKRENVIQLGAIVLTVAAFGGAVFAISRMLSSRTETNTTTSVYTPQRQSITYDGKEYYLKDNMDTILLIGVDDLGLTGDNGKYVNQSQSDVLFVVVVDHDNHTYRTLQLNRDTMTAVHTLTFDGEDDGLQVKQLAFGHVYGSTDEERCENTVEAVSGLLIDVPIMHYIQLTMDAIPILNNSVGGVTVTIPTDMTNIDPELRAGATVTLDGDAAERFIRARMSLNEDTNTQRMERQRLYLASWQSKVSESMRGDEGFSTGVLLDLTNYLVSDMTINQMSELTNTLAGYEDLGTLTIAGEDRMGVLFNEFYIDEADLEDKVIELFYEEA